MLLNRICEELKMLFDERDFSVFDNSDSKLYFKEILLYRRITAKITEHQ